MKRSSRCGAFKIVLFFVSLLSGCGHGNGDALPTVTSITTPSGKAEGPVTGGTVVSIRGTRFGNDSSVFFGDVPSPSVTVQDPSSLIATTGSVFRSSTVSVKITTGGQIVEVSNAFLYTPIVAFSSNRSGNFEIFTMAIDRTEVKQLTNFTLGVGSAPPPGEINKSPIFSPDGKEILFTTNRTDDFEIFIMDRAGTNPKNLSNKIGSSDQNPSFSPDGNSIVFSSNRTGNFEIYRMDKNGDNVKQLTFDAGKDLDPSYSPDGSKIVFVSDRVGPDTDLFIMNSSDGLSLLPLTTDMNNDVDPVFSPDGTQVLFVSEQGGISEIYVVSSGGVGSPTQLTFAQADASDPAFVAPFNNKLNILFAKRTALEKDEIFIMTCQGSGSLFISSCDEKSATNISLHVSADQTPFPSP